MGFASYITIIKKRRKNKEWESKEYENAAKVTGTIGAALFLISLFCVYSVYSYYYKNSNEFWLNDLAARLRNLDAPQDKPIL